MRDGNVSFDWAASHNSHPNVVLEFQVQNAPSFEVELDDAVVSKETFDALAAICRQRTAEADKWHDIAILRESDITRLQCEITKRDEQIEQLIRDKATLVIEAARNAKPFWRKLW